MSLQNFHNEPLLWLHLGWTNIQPKIEITSKISEITKKHQKNNVFSTVFLRFLILVHQTTKFELPRAEISNFSPFSVNIFSNFLFRGEIWLLYLAMGPKSKYLLILSHLYSTKFEQTVKAVWFLQIFSVFFTFPLDELWSPNSV